MRWYENIVNINGLEVYVEGIYRESDSMLSITYEIAGDEQRTFLAWNKVVNMWSHQEILAEDIRAKYLSKVKKIEHNLPILIEKAKTKSDVFKITDRKSDINHKE